MRQITRARFNALAAYTRSPIGAGLSVELAWFEADEANVIAVVFVDVIDGEYAAIVLAPDLLERYRYIDMTPFRDTLEEAVLDVDAYFTTRLDDVEAHRSQGDETGKPIDFFTPVVKTSKLHASFQALSAADGFGAARDIISAMMRWHDDVDGNFIEQFQSVAFDARLWELYLFAMLTEAGFVVERPSPAPDFIARGPEGTFAVEATTINPTVIDGKVAPSAKPAPGADDSDYRHHYLPIRYAGPLVAKLAKRYWEHEEVAGLPFVIAIQDFHDTASMTHSASALPEYLYGLRQDGTFDEQGRLISITPVEIGEHTWQGKTVPSGFFNQPGAENISAVIFNSLGTISKFNRMGVQAGFERSGTALIHFGTYADDDPTAGTPLTFAEVVTSETAEMWSDGMSVWHNPHAVRPLDPQVLPMAVHHRLMPDRQMESTAPKPPVFASRTFILHADDDNKLEAAVDQTLATIWKQD